jgi:peroxiredoxin
MAQVTLKGSPVEVTGQLPQVGQQAPALTKATDPSQAAQLHCLSRITNHTQSLNLVNNK